MKAPTALDVEKCFQHIYDPVKAHEYYIKNRELKGRKKAKEQPLTGRKKASAQEDLKTLPMVKGGASIGDAAEFVNSLKGYSDKQMQDEENRFRKAAASRGEAGKGPLTDRANTITVLRVRATRDPRLGKTKDQIHKDARAKQRAELSQQIKSLEDKLTKLKMLIRLKKAAQDSASRKVLGKRERAAKESSKPKTMAEKSKASREAKQYRDKHQQKIKTQAKASSSSSKSGSSSSKGHHDAKSEARIAHLEALVTKVNGKLALAKQKLAAL